MYYICSVNKAKIIKQIKKMTQLQSSKSINNLKERAIKNGGYSNVKFKNKIIMACEEHLELFGVDLTPKHLLQ